MLQLLKIWPALEESRLVVRMGENPLDRLAWQPVSAFWLTDKELTASAY